jgi:hypothetical protein
MNETKTPQDVNSPEYWEDYMAHEWDANSGRNQTRLFAKYFLEAVELPSGAKTLLDISCAKGDAMPEFHARYPSLELYGTDISSVAIEEARRSYGEIAQFDVAGFEDLSRRYDIIFCSNTLEHFENNLEIAEQLLGFCGVLYILVPYMQMRRGQRLRPEPGMHHVATFDERSFDPLLKRSACEIRSWIRYTPGAWGNGPITNWQRVKAWVRFRPTPVAPRQIFYEVRSAIA